jgi:hypothetical protein
VIDVLVGEYRANPEAVLALGDTHGVRVCDDDGSVLYVFHALAAEPPSDADRISALEGQVAALIARCDALEASLLEARAYILAINTQKPRVARE